MKQTGMLVVSLRDVNIGCLAKGVPDKKLIF